MAPLLNHDTLNKVYPSTPDSHAYISIRDAAAHSISKGPLTAASVGLIAMLLSDSGLVSAQPVWWNSSVMGCILIGLQPRGGWQIMQRSVQWGKDSLANVFGVSCSKPALYAYFACSIRNRLEVWDSNAWHPPKRQGWEWVHSNLKRPMKLIEGTRGGEGFICRLLLPQEGSCYYLDERARMLLLSVILTAAGLMEPENLNVTRLEQIMREDFELGDRLGVIFHPLLIGLIFGQLLTLVFAAIVLNSIFGQNLLGIGAPYILQLCSQISWAMGSISLLMLGGNPRVRIVDRQEIPSHIQDRLRAETRFTKTNVFPPEMRQIASRPLISSETEEIKLKTVETGVVETRGSREAVIDLEFGSIHGSVYVPSSSHCTLPTEVVRAVCRWDLELQRPLSWKLGFVWSSMFLLISVALQVVGVRIATVGSEAMSVLLLMITALVRGWGISGLEELLIPRSKMRRETSYGASLVVGTGHGV